MGKTGPMTDLCYITSTKKIKVHIYWMEQLKEKHRGHQTIFCCIGSGTWNLCKIS